MYCYNGNDDWSRVKVTVESREHILCSSRMSDICVFVYGMSSGRGDISEWYPSVLPRNPCVSALLARVWSVWGWSLVLGAGRLAPEIRCTGCAGTLHGPRSHQHAGGVSVQKNQSTFLIFNTKYNLFPKWDNLVFKIIICIVHSN